MQGQGQAAGQTRALLPKCRHAGGTQAGPHLLLEHRHGHAKALSALLAPVNLLLHVHLPGGTQGGAGVGCPPGSAEPVTCETRWQPGLRPCRLDGSCVAPAATSKPWLPPVLGSAVIAARTASPGPGRRWRVRPRPWRPPCRPCRPCRPPCRPPAAGQTAAPAAEPSPPRSALAGHRSLQRRALCRRLQPAQPLPRRRVPHPPLPLQRLLELRPASNGHKVLTAQCRVGPRQP